MKLIDADAIYQWYTDAFDFSPNEIRFSMNDIRDNLYNIPTIDAVPRELYESMEATCYKLQQALSESWIPCSERLPDKGLRVLMQLNNAWQIVGWYDKEDKQWFELIYAEPVANDRVLAWMELPQSYRGDD